MTGNPDRSIRPTPHDPAGAGTTAGAGTPPAEADGATTVPTQTPPKRLGRTRISYTWIGLVTGTLVLLLLLVFILQNTEQTEYAFLLWSFSLPLGVGVLLAAISGALIMALVGGIRILQIRRAITRS